ncbi:MAG: hypothetical protein WAN03_00840 [Candidatus Sulfotelmatobacter sp.]
MRLRIVAGWEIAVVIAIFLAVPAGRAGDKKDKEREKEKTQAVDSGSFGVFIKGQRVVTESFQIEQNNGMSTIKSQLKETGSADAAQKSELEITPSGELLRYEWSQASGGSLTVVTKNDFLLENISTPGMTKPAEQPFLMPSTSTILDNNFFVQREVLVWRYLASDCKPEGGNLKCQQGPAEFGTLVPQDRNSVRVRLELVGREKVNIHGTDRDLLRLNLSGENFLWNLWVDDHDQFKLIRVLIPADNTEVIRD